jgi:branched-chain amino acid transport system ATP-binding protein
MLEVSDLHVSYGKIHAVRGIGLQVQQGNITLILGPNGAGKTTTLRTICGLLRPTQGIVALDRKNLVGMEPHKIVRHGLIMVPEGRKIFAPLTVEENLRIGAYTTGKSRLAETMHSVYELFPILRERSRRQAGLLSGGEQQMLAFSRALMAQPKVILMDEPSMGLAPAVTASVMLKARAIADTGIAILMVEQNAEAGLEVADDVVIVARGEIVFSGSVKDARANQSVLLAFLGESALAADMTGS